MEKEKKIDPLELLSEKTRLRIMAHLASLNGPVDFNHLIENLELSKGNLSVHTSKLEQAGLINVEKNILDKKTKTTYQVTSEGRKALLEYLNYLEELLKPIKNLK